MMPADLAHIRWLEDRVDATRADDQDLAGMMPAQGIPDSAWEAPAEQADAAGDRRSAAGEDNVPSPAASARPAARASFAGVSPARPANRARRTSAAHDERAARAFLHPRTGLVAVSTINPPAVRA